MSLKEVSDTAIDPALDLLPSTMDSREARVMLLSIGLQESRLQYRRQLLNGPARGLWQFERGGVTAVIGHPASKSHSRNLCDARGVPFSVDYIYPALENDDVLAAGIARLLLWTDLKPLPSIDDQSGSWDLYVRCWRPGKPQRGTWAGLHDQAHKFVMELET